MAPSMVLLDREIDFSHDEAVSGGGDGESIRYPWQGRGLPSRKEMSDAVTEYLRTFKAHAVVADPPELSFLNILVPPESFPLPPPYYDLDSGRISSGDKNLVALYAGGYRPGSRSMGGYLIYDARKDSLSTIPPLPSDHSQAMGCQSAVVMCDAVGDGYLLAELVWVFPGFSEAALWLWKSSAPEWVLQPERLPLPSGDFSVDLCFSYQGSILCWVDLNKGMVLCDLDQHRKLSFISLPKVRPTYDVSNPKHPYWPCAEEVRSMACVRGEIKLVALDYCVENQPDKGLELTVWTLSPDLSGWSISCKYNVEKIWANVNYQSAAGTRKLAPKYPVLSIHEDGVVYLVLNDIRMVDGRLEYEGQYLLRVDMKNNEVQIYPQSTRHIYSQLFASEFSAHRQRLQDHPREIEASKFGASGKRLKL